MYIYYAGLHMTTLKKSHVEARLGCIRMSTCIPCTIYHVHAKSAIVTMYSGLGVVLD